MFGPEDFYPDAVPCLAALRARGYRVGLAGNQPERAVSVMQSLGVPADVVVSSEGWGVEKPSPAFFARVAEAAGAPSGEVAYVGDRVDNDVLPVAEAGMVSIFLCRGPWGIIHAGRPDAARAHLCITTLAQLPAALERL